MPPPETMLYYLLWRTKIRMKILLNLINMGWIIWMMLRLPREWYWRLLQNAKKNDLYSKKAYQGNHRITIMSRERKIPGTFEPDTLSKSVKTRWREDPLSPRQTTNRAGMRLQEMSLGNYEYWILLATKIIWFKQNKSGPTPTRSNFIDQIWTKKSNNTGYCIRMPRTSPIIRNSTTET